MPKLDNIKHEKFAQALSKGLTLEEAHREAGYSGNRSTAHALAAQPNISERLHELRNKIADELEYKREDFIRDLKERWKNIPEEHKNAPKYGEMLAKAQGWNEPEKIQVNGEIRIVIGGSGE